MDGNTLGLTKATCSVGVCGSLFSQVQREDQSLCSLIYYNKSLSDGQESHPRFLQPVLSFQKNPKCSVFVSGPVKMKCTVCGELSRNRMNHSEMMLNGAENCPLQKQRNISVWVESVYYLIYAHAFQGSATT